MSDAAPALSFDSIVKCIHAEGPANGLEAMIAELRGSSNHHAVFRTLLLKKRYELGLPLINPGDLSDATTSARREYEAFVEEACRETGLLYLKDKDIPQAWRYFRTISDRAPIREAIEKLDPKEATDEILNIALDQGVNPGRGFEIVLQRDGLCRAITLFDAGHSHSLADRRRAAALLVQTLYKDLVVGVVREIAARFGEVPPETDLVDLIRHRPWLFENCRTHADPSHISAISRTGLLCDDPIDLIRTLSISEYGRLLDKRHGAPTEAPFEKGYDDHAIYARALLGQDAEKNIDYYLAKLGGYTRENVPQAAFEWIIALVWRSGRRSQALDLWEKHLGDVPPEVPGQYIPSFYELCQEAKDFERLANTARKHGDLSAWGASQVLGRPAAVS